MVIFLEMNLSLLIERVKSRLIGTRLGDLAQQRSKARFRAKLASDPKLAAVAEEPYDIDRCLQRLIDRHDMTCVDVGAHLGSMTAEFLKLAPSGSHHAFEPTPRKAKWLRGRFPNVTVHQVALSDKHSTATFYDNVGNSGFSGLRSPGEFAHNVQQYEVEVTTLDAMLADVEVGFLKVDVEGAELATFRGARDLIARCRPPMLFECTKTGLENFGVDAGEIFEELTHISGYDLFVPADFAAQGQPLDAESFASAQDYPFRAFNFIAVPK